MSWGKKFSVLPALLLCAGFVSQGAFAFGLGGMGSLGFGKSSPEEFQKPANAIAATGYVEAAFSPNQGAEELVVRTIRSAKSDIRVMAYSFTSPAVVGALANAAKRGVKVYVLADYKNNIVEGGSAKKGVAALSTVATAGAVVRTISVYPIHHDKVIIVDGKTVETGSFNYSMAAAQKNRRKLFW